MSKFLELNGLTYFWSKVKAKLDLKVDKVSGKGLSTNDYTTTEKNKLSGIEAQANKYVLPTAATNSLGGVKTTSTVDSTSGLTACPIISGNVYYKDTNTTYSVATQSANGLMSSTDKTKLDGVATGANKYIHPSYTSKTSGLYKVTVDATGHVSAASSVVKSDITALGIPAQDTTYSVATTSANGLMSSTDKTQVNKISTIESNVSTLSQNKADKTYTVGFINIGMFSTLSEFQTVLLGISFNDGKPQAICTNFNASFDPYCGGNWEGHLYKASPDYFCGEITQYGSSSAVKVLFSYSNGTWSHNRVAFYTEDLLWANPDTTVGFPAQTINLSSSVTNYRLIKIHYQYMAAIGYQLETETLANVGAYALVSASTANNLYRTACLASTQIAFSDCKIQTAIGQDAVYNTGLIPYRVYGVKW